MEHRWIASLEGLEVRGRTGHRGCTCHRLQQIGLEGLGAKTPMVKAICESHLSKPGIKWQFWFTDVYSIFPWILWDPQRKRFVKWTKIQMGCWKTSCQVKCHLKVWSPDSLGSFCESRLRLDTVRLWFGRLVMELAWKLFLCWHVWTWSFGSGGISGTTGSGTIEFSRGSRGSRDSTWEKCLQTSNQMVGISVAPTLLACSLSCCAAKVRSASFWAFEQTGYHGSSQWLQNRTSHLSFGKIDKSQSQIVTKCQLFSAFKFLVPCAALHEARVHTGSVAFCLSNKTNENWMVLDGKLGMSWVDIPWNIQTSNFPASHETALAVSRSFGLQSEVQRWPCWPVGLQHTGTPPLRGIPSWQANSPKQLLLNAHVKPHQKSSSIWTLTKLKSRGWSWALISVHVEMWDSSNYSNSEKWMINPNYKTNSNFGR